MPPDPPHVPPNSSLAVLNSTHPPSNPPTVPPNSGLAVLNFPSIIFHSSLLSPPSNYLKLKNSNKYLEEPNPDNTLQLHLASQAKPPPTTTTRPWKNKKLVLIPRPARQLVPFYFNPNLDFTTLTRPLGPSHPIGRTARSRPLDARATLLPNPSYTILSNQSFDPPGHIDPRR